MEISFYILRIAGANLALEKRTNTSFDQTQNGHEMLGKGHLISKWFFEVVDFLQKTNENTSHTSKNEFIRSFFGGNR